MSRRKKSITVQIFRQERKKRKLRSKFGEAQGILLEHQLGPQRWQPKSEKSRN